jgi:hypothetical protein
MCQFFGTLAGALALMQCCAGSIQDIRDFLTYFSFTKRTQFTECTANHDCCDWYGWNGFVGWLAGCGCKCHREQTKPVAFVKPDAVPAHNCSSDEGEGDTPAPTDMELRYLDYLAFFFPEEDWIHQSHETKCSLLQKAIARVTAEPWDLDEIKGLQDRLSGVADRNHWAYAYTLAMVYRRDWDPPCKIEDAYYRWRSNGKKVECFQQGGGKERVEDPDAAAIGFIEWFVELYTRAKSAHVFVIGLCIVASLIVGSLVGYLIVRATWFGMARVKKPEEESDADEKKGKTKGRAQDSSDRMRKATAKLKDYEVSDFTLEDSEREFLRWRAHELKEAAKNEQKLEDEGQDVDFYYRGLYMAKVDYLDSRDAKIYANFDEQKASTNARNQFYADRRAMAIFRGDKYSRKRHQITVKGSDGWNTVHAARTSDTTKAYTPSKSWADREDEDLDSLPEWESKAPKTPLVKEVPVVEPKVEPKKPVVTFAPTIMVGDIDIGSPTNVTALNTKRRVPEVLLQKAQHKNLVKAARAAECYLCQGKHSYWNCQVKNKSKDWRLAPFIALKQEDFAGTIKCPGGLLYRKSEWYVDPKRQSLVARRGLKTEAAIPGKYLINIDQLSMGILPLYEDDVQVGTGFQLCSYIVTAAHVLTERTELEGGTKLEHAYFPPAVMALLRARDIALCTNPLVEKNTLDLIKKPLEQGSEVCVVGFLDEDLRIGTGRVIANGNTLIYDVYTLPGMSGSPVIEVATGKVVGWHTCRGDNDKVNKGELFSDDLICHIRVQHSRPKLAQGVSSGNV